MRIGNAISELRKTLGRRNLWLLLFFGTILLCCAFLLIIRGTDISSISASRVDRIINRRMTALEAYMQKAMDSNHNDWLELDGLEEDMVVYRYMEDTLQSWCNQFSLDNDDISQRLVVPRFANLRYNFISPLAEADTVVRYINMGPKWYLVKSISDKRGCRVIGGLEVRNTLDTRSVNGVNPRFGLGDQYSLNPISSTGGTPIFVSGQPLLKLLRESSGGDPLFPDSSLLWIVIALLVMVIMVFLYMNLSVKLMLTAMASLTILLGVFYAVGTGMQASSSIFSPTLYADGPVFYSLGAVLIINLWITLMGGCLFMGRKLLLRDVMHGASSVKAIVMMGSVLVCVAGIICYVLYSFRSLILNSDMSLELYKLTSFSRYTIYVYTSYMALMSIVPMLLQSIRVPVYHYSGLKYDIFSRWGRSLFALLTAALLLAVFSFLGIRKEANRAEIWTSRLAIDRDLGLELQLRVVENAIAADNTIAEVIRSTEESKVILNRLTETYMNRVSKDYDVTVLLFKDNLSDSRLISYYNERLANAVPIAPDSRFAYSRNSNGRAQYTGMFIYYFPDNGVVRMLVGVNSKADKEERGYSFILNENSPGSVVIPPQYSYAKYIGDKIVSYKGDYPYPTVLSSKFRTEPGNAETQRATLGAYVHFYTQVSPDEAIVVSRPKIGVIQYLVAAGMIYLLAYFWISIFSLKRKRKSEFEKNYYKSRVNTVLFVSMLLTLVTMSIIMVFFVYKRNDENVRKLMNSKITTIQSLMANRVRSFSSYRDMATPDMTAIMQDVAEYTRTDITLYSPGGKVFNSTAPEIFERMILGSRTNPEAYRNIMYSSKRYYIHKEWVAGHNFYTMYAPLINDKGKILAILSAPYTDSGLSFKADAVFHSIFVITVFFILLIITRFFTTRVVDKMFRPIIVMGRKMLSARTGGLEYIIYDKEDELSGLVRAYNLMVHDLSESGKQVAQAERERAWSEMARQVAHEIKNPLTPIKLQIQRLIRMKNNNNPNWEAKFDDISRVILDSIDVLTDTANEFSTFAKLYTEELVQIDLDALASDQISMFDDKDNISFEYYGLKGACVMGPKPQLTRVFVNLLTNAVQAIENQQEEDRNAGLEPVHGQIVLSLRNSTKDSFYDIVFEDNGPGIKDENRSRLFTPNFTTKSSGTGLGLAICKNILERCGGEIAYSSSFALKGACFTVRYPKMKPPTSV
ncbi:MAG: sensor histidine kinase [Candidatus Cryptobacteroides sp.]